VNQAVLKHLHPECVEGEIWRADELEVRRGLSSERDEMWSYVRSKANPRWLWHAIDHHTGQGLAYVFGRRQDTVFLELKELVEPFGLTRYFTDGWGAYERHVEAEQHTVGKENTQRTGCEFCQSFEPLEVMGEKQTQAGSVHQERTGQKARRSRAFRPHMLPRKPTIFLTALLSHVAMAIHLGPCEKLRRYRKLATSSIISDMPP
jgi:insertion element IS1 protein InsB